MPPALNAASANRSPGVGGAACAGTRERYAAATGGHDERGREPMFARYDGPLNTATALIARGLILRRYGLLNVRPQRRLRTASGTQYI